MHFKCLCYFSDSRIVPTIGNDDSPKKWIFQSLCITKEINLLAQPWLCVKIAASGQHQRQNNAVNGNFCSRVVWESTTLVDDQRNNHLLKLSQRRQQMIRSLPPIVVLRKKNGTFFSWKTIKEAIIQHQDITEWAAMGSNSKLLCSSCGGVLLYGLCLIKDDF